jgi:hypothetical protein
LTDSRSAFVYPHQHFLEETTKKASLSPVPLMMAVCMLCQPWDGSFDLKMGLTHNQLKAIDPDVIKINETGILNRTLDNIR